MMKARLFLLCAVLLPMRESAATVVCEDLAGDSVLIGEMRYTTTSGTDTCYANAYWDIGDELTLSCNVHMPGALQGSDVAYFRAMAAHVDETGSDCSNVLFTYRVRQNNQCTINCLSGSSINSTTSSTLRINSCSTPSSSCNGNSCEVHAAKALNVTHAASGTYPALETWLDVDTSTGCNSSDTGCFHVDDNPPQFGGFIQCDEFVNF